MRNYLLMEVFVSSIIGGMEEFRDAAAAGVRALGHRVIRAEDFGASSGTPQETCLAGIRDADVTVVLIGERYGERQASGKSATHEEYAEARSRHDVLVFIQQGVDREPAADELLEEVRAWAAGVYTASFSTVGELQEAVTRALHQAELSTVAGSVDTEALSQRSRGLHPEERRRGLPTLSVSVVGGPTQQIVRPAALESAALAERIQQEAMFGAHRVLRQNESTEVRVEGDALLFEQPAASIRLDETGSVRVLQGLGAGHQGLPAIIEEDLVAATSTALVFSAWLLDELDTPRRLRTVAVSIALLDASVSGWMTRDEYGRSPNSMTMHMPGEFMVVDLNPPTRARASLSQEATQMAEDLMVGLRRVFKRP